MAQVNVIDADQARKDFRALSRMISQLEGMCKHYPYTAGTKSEEICRSLARIQIAASDVSMGLYSVGTGKK